MAMNKAVTKQVMEQAGIPTLPWRELTYREEDIPRLVKELPLPAANMSTRTARCPRPRNARQIPCPDTRDTWRSGGPAWP